MLFSRLNQRKLLGLVTIGIVLLTVITFVHAADVDPPIWQNQGQSVSSLVVGGSNLLYAQGKDETSLRKAVLSTNETGTWTNYTGDVGGWVNAEGWILVDRFNRPDSGSIGNAEYPQTAWNTSGGTISISRNSLKIVGGGAGVTAKATQSYSASDTYTVEGNASFAQISDWPAIALDYGTTSNRLGFSARSDGYVYYLASPGWVKSTKAYSANAWYNCRITVYPSTHKADYYFDGTLLAANVSYYQSAVTDPNVLRISQYNSAATLYADEIFAYEGQTKPAQYPSRSLYGSPMDLGDVADTWVWSNFTWHNPSIAGGTSVAWRIYYEDASSNMKATDIITFSVTPDTNPPQWRSQGESKSTLYAGESVGLYAQGFDDNGLHRAVLSTNETGYWVNYTGTPYEVISGLTWTDYSGNPILPLGAPGEWDSAETGGPDVIVVNDTYYMYYAGHNGSAWSMGLAFSDDGISWTKYENNPVLTGTPGEWDQGTLWVPNVIRFNETHFIWVYGATSAGIGVAWSTDGIHWSKYANNPVITPTPGWYDSAEAEGGHTVLVNGTLYLYIIGYASDGTGARGGVATSTDGIHWTKIPGPFTYNSILDIGPPGSVDDVEVEPEEPLILDGVWYLCYSYRSTSAYWKCGLAISDDGVNFVKDVNNPLKGQGWTGGWAKRTHINIKSKDGSTRYMYYNSNGQTGMAMAPVTMSMRQTYGSPMDMGNVSGSWVWSNYTWQNASVVDGTTVAWRIYYEDTSGNVNATDIMTFQIGVKPALNIIPTTKTCRMYNETFIVNIDVTTESNITDFEFELDFNTTLLDYSNINWSAWGTGTVTVDEMGGKLTGHTWGSMISGSQTLVSLRFNATLHHIWKNLAGWVNDQNGKIFIQAANLSYPGPVKLRYERGGSNEINVGPDSTYTFSPIQGDVDNSGLVDIFDLRTVAAYYDQGNATYNLTGDSIIDIFDLVIIGVNYNYKYNP